TGVQTCALPICSPLRPGGARYEIGPLEHFEVLRDRGSADFEWLRHFADGGRSLGESRQDRSPRWIGQCGEDEAQRVTPFQFTCSLIEGVLNYSEVRRNEQGQRVAVLRCPGSSAEHTSELQPRCELAFRLLLE